MNEKQRTNVSRFLSLVLRHEPSAADVELDTNGWVDVERLLGGCAAAGRTITRAELDEVVATNSKKRFEFSADGTRIRASQGHSVAVDLGYEPADPPAVLYHGTARANVEAIEREGLQRGARHHVHLSPDVETATAVGRRHGEPVVFEVDAAGMAAAGVVFCRSTNGVWLVDSAPPAYLRLVDGDRTGSGGR